MKKRVLFICTHNSARSQMAEGLLNALCGQKYIAYSAGTYPTRVHPVAIKVMEEIGIDISGHHSKSIDEFRGEKFDIVITVCDNARETCPFFPGSKVYLHKSFPDPSQAKEDNMVESFRRVRDEIKKWILNEFGEGG